MRKHLRYLSYVLRHKWFVLVAGRRTGAPLWRLLVHDWSKFTPGEWFAYTDFFYAPKPVAAYGDARLYGGLSPGDVERITTARQQAFDRAWLHHQHANPHHWQHWVLREDSGVTKLLPMPEHFVREMVADWMGAGRAITGKWEAGAWYEKNAERIQLEHRTRIRVEGLLGRHAGLRCIWDCPGGSPTYCRELGGCEAHCAQFFPGDKGYVAKDGAA